MDITSAGIAIIGFLSGSLLTALGFIFGWSNKVTTLLNNQETMNKSITELKKNLDAHIAQPPTCLMHTGILIDVDRLKDRVFGHERGD